MKHYFFLIVASLTIISSFFSCSNTTDKSSTSDSTRSDTKKDTTIVHGNNKSTKNAFLFEKTLGALEVAPRPIDTPTQGIYGRGYQNAPSFIDQSGEPILGFMIDTATDASGNNKDFQTIIHTPGIDNIYIQLGIKGSFIDADGQLRNIYTVMFVPIGKDKKPFFTKQIIGGILKTSAAYDVACPCINGKGCCPVITSN